MRGTTDEIVGVDVFSIVFEKNANPLNPPLKQQTHFSLQKSIFSEFFFHIERQLRQIHDDMNRATAP